VNQPQTEPITNQEIHAVADRVARSLIADMLAEAHIYLDDLIDREIDTDPDAGRLDAYTHGHVYGLVWDQLGRAAAEYARRDQVLTEEAAKLRAACPHLGDADPCLTDCQCPAADALLAARAQQEQEAAR